MDQNKEPRSTHAYMVNELMTKELRICSEESIVSSINGVGKTG